jgi:hypothetical protein
LDLVTMFSHKGFVVFFEFGDAPVFVHHLLKVGAALCWGAGGQVLGEGFEDLADSEST